MRGRAVFFSLIASGCLVSASPAAWAAPPSYTLFESAQVRPLALSRDHTKLFAVNTPDNRLEIFQTRTPGGLGSVGSVPVGVEPVAVAVRSENEVWVVNHLSDSVSIVKIDGEGHAYVARTLLVGDEPRDIVFAGANRERAFITTAHRGQNSLVDPQLTTPGVGRADVWVFDANKLGDTLGGTPLTIITLFTDTPRALAVTPDGRTVYAAGHLSGNRTTSVNEHLVMQNGDRSLGPFIPFGPDNASGLPAPTTAIDGTPQAPAGLIVKFDGQAWRDNLGRDWSDKVRFNLPDKDVFIINAEANPPQEVPARQGPYTGVGTVLFNMIVNPVSGKVYVANTDANNINRFEGPGLYARETTGLPSVRGHLAESHITVLDGGSVLPRHLNKHIDYSHCCDPNPEENAKSLAFPQGMAITGDGKTLYVTAFGSSKVGIFDTASLEDDTFVPDTANQIVVSGGGPSGAVLDENSGSLYVMTRFDDAISVVDTQARAEVAHVPMHNPEPPSVRNGRRFLYDASYTSSHGDSACASCHISGDFDGLAWDLGNPDDTASELVPVPPPTLCDEFFPGTTICIDTDTFTAPNLILPMHFLQNKGPMTTQSLRGMDNHGSMHWRGDRTGGNDVLRSSQPDTGIFDEKAAFKKFQVAFTGLVGRSQQLSDQEMDEFTQFILEVVYPPNPIRNLDNSLTIDQQAGKNFFMGVTMNGLPSDGAHPCEGCHILNPAGNAQYDDVARPGFFGSDGRYAFDAEYQYFKVPHLRNLYQKVGMFGMADTWEGPTNLFLTVNPGNNGQQGDQVRGFGFTHDGSFDTLFRFFNSIDFDHFPLLDYPFVPPQDSIDFNFGGFPMCNATYDLSTPISCPATDNYLGTGRPFPGTDTLRRQVEQFMLAFDSNMAPIVGQQITLDAHNGAVAGPRLGLFEARAVARECDLIAKAGSGPSETGYLYEADTGVWIPSRALQPPVGEAQLRAAASHDALSGITFTCAPPGSGTRMALDRDGDGYYDGDELDAGSNPADPSSTPLHP